MKTRIMYIERKAGKLTGDARIGRVTFNKTGRTIFYRDLVFRRIVGGGFKSNYFDEKTGEEYWTDPQLKLRAIISRRSAAMPDFPMLFDTANTRYRPKQPFRSFPCPRGT